MQSLKSTAFAVTLLAISCGLYCVSSDVSSNSAALEPELDNLIQIDSSLSTSQFGSMAPPSQNANHQSDPIQISTNVTPNFSNSSASTLQAPELPKLQTPNLNSNISFNVATTQPATTNQAAPLLPSLSNGGSQTKLAPNLSNPSPLQLPEIASRQPVNTSPSTRDDGLINALGSNNLKPNNNGVTDISFKPSNQPLTATSPVSTDNSYNSLATAVDKEEDSFKVKSADGLVGSAFGSQPASKPTSIAPVWAEVDRLVAADEYRIALRVLSKHYGKKGLTGPQQQKLQGWLDALAGKVIYSTEHLFVKQPYVVQPGETLESIARNMKVPTEVIYNINQGQFAGRNEVSPGMKLKAVNGPFHAEVDLDKKMMTLFVKNLYAGRFPVAVGISGNPGEGNYDVKVKSPNGFTWRDANGREYPAGAPGNGYGPYWMGLSGSLCIHAVPSGTPHGHRGCIGLSEKDAKDVYGILSKDSQISIVR